MNHIPFLRSMTICISSNKIGTKFRQHIYKTITALSSTYFLVSLAPKKVDCTKIQKFWINIFISQRPCRHQARKLIIHTLCHARNEHWQQEWLKKSIHKYRMLYINKNVWCTSYMTQIRVHLDNQNESGDIWEGSAETDSGPPFCTYSFSKTPRRLTIK